MNKEMVKFYYKMDITNTMKMKYHKCKLCHISQKVHYNNFSKVSQETSISSNYLDLRY